MAKRLKICLINPRFEPSYWGFDYALPLYPGRVKCTMVTGSLPHLASLTPDHEVYILDENVEAIDFAFLQTFDVVGVTGMNVQKYRMREILLELRERKIFTAVGGAYASVDEKFFDGLCDVLFSGEADETWPQFVEQFAGGKPYENFFKQAQPTDMSTLPTPRFDLLKVKRYATGSIQFSRGCPFQCEFCDIIVTFGRRPRMKRPEQVIEELDQLRKLGFFGAFIVDDNFIGNKKAAKQLLRDCCLAKTARLSVAWHQASTIWPTILNCSNCSTGQFSRGILSRAASLKETKKFQNVAGDSLDAKLARIQNAGLDISAGFIVGFDNDDESIFEDQYRFIQDNGIVLAMVGMLTAIPKTPLYERLEQEGRLRLHDFNCNFVPKLMTPERLQSGYWELLRRLYAPESFLERYFKIYHYPEFRQRRAAIIAKAHEGKILKTLVYGLILAWNLFWTLLKEKRLKSMGTAYWRLFRQHRRLYQKGIVGFTQFVNRCVAHWHFWKFTDEGTTGKLRMFNSG
jgi:radical SAM superfamily enzyme YgiQ (UPF0313 family)